MRRKIWASASYLPRLIELNKGCFVGNIDASVREYVHYENMRIAAPSSQPPAVLSVCRESRDEAKKASKLVQFNHNVQGNALVVPDTWLYPKTWYNKVADIIYLGRGSCVATLIMLLQTGMGVTRVAVPIEDYEHTHQRCRWENNSSWTPFQGIEAFLDPNIDRVTRYLRVLHGFEPSGTRFEKAFPGCKTLHEVFFLAKPALIYPDIMHIDNCVGIEKIIGSDGPGRATRFTLEVNIKGKLASALQVVDANKWIGSNEPAFHISRLYFPKSSAKKAGVIALHISNRILHRMM